MQCEKCNSEMSEKYGSGRFCSSACARAFSTLLRREEINTKVAKSMTGKVSPTKGIKFGPLSSETKRKMRESSERKWQTTEWSKVPKSRRRDRILIEQNGCCAICKNPPVWLGEPLKFQLDHVSGDKTDESRINLRLLCPNCHYQTPTWGARNASPAGRQRTLEALAKGRTNRK